MNTAHFESPRALHKISSLRLLLHPAKPSTAACSTEPIAPGNAGGHGRGEAALSPSLLLGSLHPRGLIAGHTRFSRQEMTLFTPFTSPLRSAKVSVVANRPPRVGGEVQEGHSRSLRTMLQPKNPEAPSAQRRKVLLVGAEPSVQGLISTFLLTMGWTCTVVQNKEETPAILQRETFDAVVIDLGPDEVDAEQAVLRVKQIRPSLRDRMIAISNGNADHKMLELMERHDLIQLPQEGLLSKLWAALQELVVSPRSRELTQRRMPLARMIFDSSRYPLPPGVRGLAPGTRQLAYQHKRTIIDVSMEFAEGSGRMSLAGQVLDADRKAKNEGLSVVLVSGTGTLARTATNEFGEFQIECAFPEDVSLEIRLGERSWVLVPLGKMDWARQRGSVPLAGN
jgi:CheY-like chemotaxis protein